uniref:ATP synthase F0 subunit 8 n=1 Tax=Cobbenicoris guangxiensis TaxID=3020184 RepID=UPI00241128AB|nr:ATP synthase F0 subunit 8 [Cobbenicoris guangxiensis]WEM32408.1 ATP synthase F0 subunit 8 [Cobbenicoris guangxiensis]
MPQMMPMWWEMLLLMFITIMLSLCIMIYHNKKYNNDSKIYKVIYKQMHWTW